MRFLAVLLILCGCVSTGERVRTRLYPGMNRKQLLTVMGDPARAMARRGNEVLVYFGTTREDEFYVLLEQGLVTRFGKAGEFVPKKPTGTELGSLPEAILEGAKAPKPDETWWRSPVYRTREESPEIWDAASDALIAADLTEPMVSVELMRTTPRCARITFAKGFRIACETKTRKWKLRP